MGILIKHLRAGKEDKKRKEVLKDTTKRGSGLLEKPLPRSLSSCHMHEDNTFI